MNNPRGAKTKADNRQLWNYSSLRNMVAVYENTISFNISHVALDEYSQRWQWLSTWDMDELKGASPLSFLRETFTEKRIFQISFSLCYHLLKYCTLQNIMLLVNYILTIFTLPYFLKCSYSIQKQFMLASLYEFHTGRYLVTHRLQPALSLIRANSLYMQA